MDKMHTSSANETLSSLRAQLSTETQARQQAQSDLLAVTSRLDASQKLSKQQRAAFESWAVALEQQVEANNRVLAGKVKELEAVKKQLEVLQGMGKGDEKEAWAMQQRKFEGELASSESARRSECEELRKALTSAENESIEKDSLLKMRTAELQIAKESFQQKESSLSTHISILTSQLSSLTSQLSALQDQRQTDLLLFSSEKAALEASKLRCENEKNASNEEIRRLQTTVSLLTNQIKSLQQENSGLQELAQTQETGKTRMETEHRCTLTKVSKEAQDWKAQCESAQREIAALQGDIATDQRRIAEINREKTAMQEKCTEITENLCAFSEEVRGHLLVESTSPPMEKYQKDLNDYRTQLGKCQVALSKYEEMIEIGSERLKSLELVVQSREREIEVLRKALKKHKLPVPTIPESSGLAGEMRRSVTSKGSKKPQVTDEPCACSLF